MIDFTDKDRAKVELISDDFQSTFTVTKSNVLVNMLRTREKTEVTNIIKKHLGNVSVQFYKSGHFDEIDGYDIYAIVVDEIET